MLRPVGMLGGMVKNWACCLTDKLLMVVEQWHSITVGCLEWYYYVV